MKVTLKILLAAAVVLLVYMCYKSVTGPIEYDDQKTIRDNAIIARLIEIRKAQIEYKNMYKTHAGSFDDLEKFLNTDKLPFLIKEGFLKRTPRGREVTDLAYKHLRKNRRTDDWQATLF